MGERILITGITGSSGSWLAEYLISRKRKKIYGLARNITNPRYLKRICSKVSLQAVDLRDFKKINRIIRAIKPTQVYHLASEQFFSPGQAGQAIYEINFIGTLNLLEALHGLGREVGLIMVGSSSQYGLVPLSHFPIREDEPMRPLNFYGVSKAAQELAAYPYTRSKNMRIVFTRTFNLIGPRQKANLALSNFASQIARLEKGSLPPVIEVGDIKASRDFLDVRDAVRAYHLLMGKGKKGEVYNICSGKAATIEEALEILLGLSPLKIKFRIIPERIKPMDIPRQEGDYNKIFKLTGWQPEIPLKQSLEDLLEWWRGLV